MNKININDPSAWHDLDWNEPVVPEILKKSDRVVETSRQNRLKAQDPAFIEKLRLGAQRVLADPEKVKARKEAAGRAGKTKRNSSEYKKLMTTVNREKAKNPEFAENVRKSIKEKFQDPQYIERYKTGRKNMNKTNIIASNQSRDKTKQSEACRKATLESLKDPTVVANRKAGYAKKYKPCQQGIDGPVYPSRKHAAIALGVDPRVVGKWIQANRDGWRYLL